jgi:universal stress protein E
MKRFKNILFINYGETEREMALQKAVNLAKINQALLTVVEVLEELPNETQSSIETGDIKNFEKIAVQESNERLGNLIAPIKQQGVQVTRKVLQGTPFIEIIREVLRNKHDLVMVNPRKKTKLKGILFGSRTMHLMRKCPCPVWAIKPAKRKKYARILAAVDSSPFNDERNALDIKIMELATSLAELEGSELHVVHCWTYPHENMLRNRLDLPPGKIPSFVREERKAHKVRLDQLMERFNLNALPHKVHLLKGDPAALIVDQARKKRIELVVMGTVCRTGLAGFFIGNTAEKVLQEVDCSVLAVKPEGFVTPVKLEE